MKTTVYLPDDLKRALEVEAADRRVSEAELIREAIRSLVGDPKNELPPSGVFRGGAGLARSVDQNLTGFGSW
ncbi:MAG: ribbon-helix-helix domain-containing protein [Bifidobacteriaceae bacterium]|jgi:plasmid stability protein|nr:ribbon-helix-helix domain-containing protein [Bifidobacteriaceae bacterium]